MTCPEGKTRQLTDEYQKKSTSPDWVYPLLGSGLFLSGLIFFIASFGGFDRLKKGLNSTNSKVARRSSIAVFFIFLLFCGGIISAIVAAVIGMLNSRSPTDDDYECR